MSWKKHEYPEGFYVYELIDPFTNIPYYVGKGIRNRAYSHLTEALGSPKSSAKLNRIRSIIDQGGEYIVKVVQSNLEQTEACDLEVSLIRKYGRINYDKSGVLTNILASTHQADFSKVIYLKGEDHHSFGKSRSKESIAKQKATCELKATALRSKLCGCGCESELPKWLVNKSRKARSHNYASWHFEGLSNNSERHRKIEELNKKFGV